MTGIYTPITSKYSGLAYSFLASIFASLFYPFQHLLSLSFLLFLNMIIIEYLSTVLAVCVCDFFLLLFTVSP